MFSEYVKKLADVQKLTPTEERELWCAYKERGDEAARQRIIESYQPLVFREVMPYRALSSVMDAVQEGTIGLIEAVERYDPGRGAAFSLYAVHRIRGRIRDFLRHEGQADLPCLEAEMGTVETAKELLVGVLGAAMERLPARERLVLEGVTIGGARAQTMAASLGVTPAQIYRLQQNGIRRIRGMLSRFMQHW